MRVAAVDCSRLTKPSQLLVQRASIMGGAAHEPRYVWFECLYDMCIEQSTYRGLVGLAMQHNFTRQCLAE